MTLLAEIKACQTMKELDELRFGIVKDAKTNPSNFPTLQKAFIHRMHGLMATGHSRFSEGYTLHEVMEAHHKREAEQA